MSVELVTDGLFKVEITKKPYILSTENTLDTLDKNILEPDSKVCELLELLDEYEKLANDLWRVHFVNGFLDLSRANYNGSRKHGLDSFDLRPYSACSVVEKDENLYRLVDRLAAQQALLRRQEEEKKNKEKGKREKNEEPKKLEKLKEEKSLSLAKSEFVNDDLDAGFNEKSTTLPSIFTEGQLRKRNGKAASSVSVLSKSLSTQSFKILLTKLVASYRDPINQFGGLVPYQLRRSQEHFKEALKDSVRMANLQLRIVALIKDIEA